MSPVNMRPSAFKHGFELEEAIHVMAFPVGRQLIRKTSRGEEWAYVGYPHEGSDRKLELLAEFIRPNTIEFHLMDLTDI